MGLWSDLTGSVEGLTVLVIIGTISGVFIAWLILGDELVSTLRMLLLEVLLPGGLMILGLAIVYFKGWVDGDTRWVIAGFVMSFVGMFLAIGMRWA